MSSTEIKPRATRLTRNVRIGQTLSFDGKRISITALQRTGKDVRLQIEVLPDVVIDKGDHHETNMR